MKKLIPIVTIFHTSNFIDEANKEGQVIDFSGETVFQLVPFPSLRSRLQSFNGHIIISNHFTQILLPFDFSKDPPLQSLHMLPRNLLFFINAADTSKARFTGLLFDRRIIFITPAEQVAEYTFDKKTVECKPAVIDHNNNLVHHMHAQATLDEISRLVQQPLGNDSQILDLKINIAGTTITVIKDEDLKKVHTTLQAHVNKVIAVEFSKNATDIILRQFPKILITETPLPPGVIGIIQIPLAFLNAGSSEPGDYKELNKFVVHFPSFKSSIEITLNTSQFDNNSELFFDDVKLGNLDITDLGNERKQVKTILTDLPIYLRKQKQLVIKKDGKKVALPINPMDTYNPNTKTARITINK